MHRGLRTLTMWIRPRFLALGPTLWATCHRGLLMTDASLTGWGATLDGRPAQGEWDGHQLGWHINCLELTAVFLALKYFLPQLRSCHVLVRVDNTATVFYISHQGGLLSRNLNRIARQIFLWAQDKSLSLRTVYILEEPVCRSRFTVLADIIDWGMETPPRHRSISETLILQRGSGPLCLFSDSAMSPLLLSESPSPAWVWTQWRTHGRSSASMSFLQWHCSRRF